MWVNVIVPVPAPDTANQVSEFGYRWQTDWMAGGAGAEPDMPEPLHNVVAMYALARAYGQQEDPEMTQMYMGMFERDLNEQGRRLTEATMGRPLILNRFGQYYGRRRTLLRPYFDWEI
jgi:hypothetical protein